MSMNRKQMLEMKLMNIIRPMVEQILNEDDSIKKKMQNPLTGKYCTDLHINGKGIFRWNTAYKVYNSVENYDQLKKKDITNIDWNKSS